MSDPAASAALLDAARHLVQAGKPGEAIQAAQAAAEADPANTEAYFYWGVSAAESGRFPEAVGPLRTAVARAPPGSFGWQNAASQLARALSNVGLWGEAFANAVAIEALTPPDPSIQHRLGAVFSRLGMVQRSLPLLERAANTLPDRPEMRHDLGIAYLSLGRADEAEALLERAIALAPLWPEPHLTLSALRRWTTAGNHVDRLRALAERPETGQADRASIGFALAKEFDDLGRIAEAWPALQVAHAQARELESPWSGEDDRSLIDALIERFPADLLSHRPSPDEDAAFWRTPIFVVGLPRSGTTLVERILAAHPEVSSVGEAPSFPLLFRASSTAPDRRELSAESVSSSSQIVWANLAKRYLAETAGPAGPAQFTVDKLPFNSLLVGALRACFPRSPIVLLRRGAMDNLLSAYRVQFAGLYGWAGRLEDMAEHWSNHARLMEHWRACLGDGLIEVSYEALVRDPEPEIRRLLEACGLAFDARCLRPHEAAGAVRTASIAQVRGPISAASVGGWRRYAEQLKPLRAHLASRGFAAD